MKIINALILTTAIVSSTTAYPCSRALWADNGQAVVVGRNMDWSTDLPANLWVLPRGMKRNGLTGKNTLEWTSKYGSMVASVRDIATVDGFNEAGLNANLLWLAETNYGERDEKLPGLMLSIWAQFMLDNFATVADAVKFIKTTPFQLVTMEFEGRPATVHLSLADVSGDSAIIEYIDGKARIHHSKDYKVMTNSPPFDQQLKQLSQYQDFGGTKPLPGTNDAADRFVRASYYLKQLPKPHNLRETLGSLLSVMRNVSQPFGLPDDPSKPNQSQTRWRTLIDLTNRTYFFESTLSPNIVWAHLNKFDLKPGAPVMKLDLIKNPDRIGDVSNQFVKAKPFTFLH